MNQAFIENNFAELVQNDPARQRAIAQAGGKASGVSRKKKKAESMYLSALLNAAFMMDFASEEELAEFKKWRKRKKHRCASP